MNTIWHLTIVTRIWYFFW